MLWKRSVIKDFSHKFPSEFAELVLDTETIKIEAGHSASLLKEAFDPDNALEFETAVIGQEIIYTLDEDGVLEKFSVVKYWEGPYIELNESVEWSPPDPLEDLLEGLHEMNPEALYPTGFEKAIIGIVERFGMEPQILLDRGRCIEILMKDGMTNDEAEEYFSFNVIGAWMGEGTPCFAVIDKSLI